MQESNKQDEFRVGDTVWCLLNGEGQVISTEKDIWSDFNIEVQFKHMDEGETWFYTKEGKLNVDQNRTLFFSEPKIEASVTRPFVPTLVGKRVVVRQKGCHDVMLNITFETPDIFGDDEGGFDKSLVEVYEVSLENLLKP